MVTLYLEDETSFMERYHQRSKAETVYSMLKTCFGNHLSSRKRSMQRRELLLKVVAYNVGRTNLDAIKKGLRSF